MIFAKPSNKFQADSFSNLNCPLHINAEYEVLCCKKGSMDIYINDEKFVIGQNQTIFIMPFEYHRFTTPKASECVRFIIYTKSVPDFSDIMENKKVSKRIFSTDLKTLNYIEYILSSNPDKLTAKTISYALCHQILKHCKFSENTGGELSLFTKALDFISKNFATGITLESTAKALGIHPVHLSRTFSKNSKYSFTSYLNLMKFSHAQMLLKTTDKTITEISFEAGFNSLRNFNRIFYSIAKLTPTQYRNSSGEFPF